MDELPKLIDYDNASLSEYMRKLLDITEKNTVEERTAVFILAVHKTKKTYVIRGGDDFIYTIILSIANALQGDTGSHFKSDKKLKKGLEMLLAMMEC